MSLVCQVDARGLGSCSRRHGPGCGGRSHCRSGSGPVDIRHSPLSSRSETTNAQVVNAIDRTQEVSLLSLGVQGIEKKADSTTTYFGIVVPGSGRTKFLQYSFDAKLGVDGENVSIEQTGENEFTVTISAFTFIGYDNMHFESHRKQRCTELGHAGDRHRARG